MQQNKNANAVSRFFSKDRAWGYWVGSLLLVLSFVSLGLGLFPLATAAQEKVKIVSVPGETDLNLKMPGTYIGIMEASKLGVEEAKRAQELEYFMLNSATQEPLEVQKIPPSAYAVARVQNQVPLFQISVSQAGKYLFSSNYPYYLDGPSLPVVLVNMDMGYVVREVIVGAIVFLIFMGLGIWVFVKTYKSRKKGKVN